MIMKGIEQTCISYQIPNEKQTGRRENAMRSLIISNGGWEEKDKIYGEIWYGDHIAQITIGKTQGKSLTMKVCKQKSFTHRWSKERLLLKKNTSKW